MKSSVAVTLIAMGTLLILAPIGADYIFQRNLVALLSKAQSPGPLLTSQLSDWYRIVVWLTGSLMVVVGTLAALVENRNSYYDLNAVDDEDEADENN